MLKTLSRILLLLVTLAIAMVLAVIVYSAVIYPMYLESRAKIGMDRNEVLANFENKHYVLSETLQLCEISAWYGDCEGAMNSGSVEFLTMKIGIDTWLVVGFNSQAKVAFVGRGDT